MQTFMLSAPLQESYRAERIEYIPMHLRSVSRYIEQGKPFDLSIVQLGQTEEAGCYSGGLNVDLLDVVLGNSACVIAEINTKMPAPIQSMNVASQAIDYVVDTDRAPTPLNMVETTEQAQEIGRLVAGLINDGDCLQTGIGSIPNAVLNGLRNKNDLGLHSGIVDDGVMMLAEEGILTGKAKTIDKHLMVVCMAIGSQELYQWTASRKDLHIKPVSYTHDQGVLCQLDHFVSINSALEIDFFGQVNSEMINGRQVAGTGGAVDFMRGAAASRGGRSIVALTATAAKGQISRIVPAITDMNAITAARTDIDLVVTEFGVADLRYLPSRSRGDALIEVADPRFRDELREKWRAIRPRL
jgi:4-hydroxybutyrate CoA-transferase